MKKYLAKTKFWNTQRKYHSLCNMAVKRDWYIYKVKDLEGAIMLPAAAWEPSYYLEK